MGFFVLFFAKMRKREPDHLYMMQKRATEEVDAG